MCSSASGPRPPRGQRGRELGLQGGRLQLGVQAGHESLEGRQPDAPRQGYVEGPEAVDGGDERIQENAHRGLELHRAPGALCAGVGREPQGPSPSPR